MIFSVFIITIHLSGLVEMLLPTPHQSVLYPNTSNPCFSWDLFQSREHSVHLYGFSPKNPQDVGLEITEGTTHCIFQGFSSVLPDRGCVRSSDYVIKTSNNLQPNVTRKMHDLASHVFYSFTVTLGGMFTYFLYFPSSGKYYETR